jgi:hypothetical protein
MQVSIVFDEFGQIISVNRPARADRVIVLGGNGQSVLVTEVDEAELSKLMGDYRVDVGKKTLVRARY